MSRCTSIIIDDDRFSWHMLDHDPPYKPYANDNNDPLAKALEHFAKANSLFDRDKRVDLLIFDEATPMSEAEYLFATERPGQASFARMETMLSESIRRAEKMLEDEDARG